MTRKESTQRVALLIPLKIYKKSLRAIKNEKKAQTD